MLPPSEVFPGYGPFKSLGIAMFKLERWIYLSESVAPRKRSGLEDGSENYTAPLLLITLQQSPVIMMGNETQHLDSVAYAPCIGRSLHWKKPCYEMKSQSKRGEVGRGPGQGQRWGLTSAKTKRVSLK